MAVIKTPQSTKEVSLADIKSMVGVEQEPESDLEDAETQVTVEDDGTVVVDFLESAADLDDLLSPSESDHDENLVQYLTEDQLDAIALTVYQNFQDDESSRSDWLSTIEFGLDLLGVKIEEKNQPFEGACSAQHPLLMESAVKFQSKASNELLPANGPVKTQVVGDHTEEKENQAMRVRAHMNYQITEEMTEFYVDTERLLLYMPLVGSGFKKTYYNAHLGRPCSEFVPADQFLVPNSASDLHRAPHYTHILYKTGNQLEADCAAGLYIKPEDGLGLPTKAKTTPVQEKTNILIGIDAGLGEGTSVYTLYEQHVMLHIDGIDEYENAKGYKLASPYVVTIDSDTMKVLGIRRNWEKGDKKRIKKVAFTHYQFVPSFNFYGYGFLHLLGNLQLSLTSALRSLVDAGQFATLQGGFKLKGVRISDDGSPIYPGQFKDIEAATMDISKAIMPLPFKEPSQTLYMMLEFLDRKGQKFADSAEQVIADSTNYGPVGTTMALLEASTKFFSAIHKRLHNSLKEELRLIAKINRETLPDDLEYNVENEKMAVTRTDYSRRVDIIPVSDPNVSSSAHRMVKAQAVLQMALQAPQIHDLREAYKHVYNNMDLQNVDKLLPDPNDVQANDPMTDIQLAVQGKPIKAFEGQNHQAHIALKQAFLQDPNSGANPLMQRASAAIQANIQEHMLMQFVEQTKAQSQIGQIPEEEAAKQIALMNQQQALEAQKQQQQSPRDQAALLLAQAELIDSETNKRKQMYNELLSAAKLELDKEELDLAAAKLQNEITASGRKGQDKINEIVTTKALDAMIQGLSQKSAMKPSTEKT
jgi:hypothetical protein